MIMNYQKRKYDEIKSDFILSWGEPKFFRFMQNEAMLGISNDGLWIGPDTCRNSTKLGFYEWEWINRILISHSEGLIYIVINDFDNVTKAIVPMWQKADFYSSMVSKNRNEKAIIVTGNQIRGDYQNFIDLIQNNNLTELEIIQ